MTDILDRIDAVTGDLCACGCGLPLDPAGPSGWWATEWCQQVWQRGGRQNAGSRAVHLPNGEMLVVDPEAVRDVVRRGISLIEGVFRAFATAMEGMAPAIRRLAEQIESSRLAGETPPDDPMELALYLRRNRNTGPKLQQRAPRRIDARRSR